MRAVWECTRQNWQIGIGDPGVMGWVIVALYVLTGLLAFVVASRAPFPYQSMARERLFWRMSGLILLALALNKQLDLQSMLTAAARCASQIQGWYEMRRVVQVGFIGGVVTVALIVLVTLWRSLRGTLRRNGLALAGLIVVLTFVAIRAAGFHHMDALINLEIENFRLNWLLEMTGPVLITICGALNLTRRRG